MVKGIQHITTQYLFEKQIVPLLFQAWKGSGEGVLKISSRACNGVPCSGANLDRTEKLIEVTIEGWESLKFHLQIEDAKGYPYRKPKQLDSICDVNGMTNVVNCVQNLLLDTWRTTAHGVLIIKSKKRRNGNIEVIIGTTPTHLYIIDPTQITSDTEELTIAEFN